MNTKQFITTCGLFGLDGYRFGNEWKPVDTGFEFIDNFMLRLFLFFCKRNLCIIGTYRGARTEDMTLDQFIDTIQDLVTPGARWYMSSHKDSDGDQLFVILVSLKRKTDITMVELFLAGNPFSGRIKVGTNVGHRRRDFLLE